MKHHLRYFLLLILFAVLLAFQTFAVQPLLKLRYNFPATNWMTSALPIGNGEFGGMFFGDVSQEHMQFNDKTLWDGSITSRGAYQNFGDLYLNFPSQTTYTNYKRELSLDEAIGRVSYNSNGVLYLREYFASNPDSAIVMRFTTPGSAGKLTFNVNLVDAHTGTTIYSGNKITMAGKLTTIAYETQVVVVNEGGTLTTTSNRISVANADAVTIILTGATNYNPESLTYVSGSATGLHNRVTERIVSNSAKSYDELKTNHLNDFQPLFSRVKLDLDVREPDINTDDLVRSNKDNPYLDILYYQYGRYLMLGSSRGLSLPSNLQGLWNNVNNPAWQCDIHSNINVQMNYWPAENTNLSECHTPFLNYINFEALKNNGSWSNMAKSLNCRGWAIKTQNNVFGYSDWNWNRPANAWYCMHLWQHFAYTNDTTYLKNKAFPSMKAACEFWFDRLKTDARGKLVAPNEWSPEQGNWEDNVAYAQQLIWELFDNTLKAAKLINADATFISTLTDKFAKLDNGVHIGPWGEIKEWTTQPDVQGNAHRHLSPLIALYPGNQISYHRDSASVKAAIVLLNSRGDGGTGWSRAWKISCWARLFDGDHAYKLMKAAQNLTTYTSVSMTEGLGGVYENLLDAHPSFQIDGNFGFTAGVTEMLIQSNQGFIYPLPALPSVWPSGSYKGLKAIGNFTVDLMWKNSHPYNAVIYSGSGDSCRVYYPSLAVSGIVCNGVNVEYRVNNDMLVFASEKGKAYAINFNFGTATTDSIAPFYKINSEAKTGGAFVEPLSGSAVTLSPESGVAGGNWSWRGPNNFTDSKREITFSKITFSQSGNYIVTQVVNGVKFSRNFNILVRSRAKSKLNILTAGDYYIKKSGFDLYWTNTNVSGSGLAPSFQAKGTGTNADAQVWTISLDSGYYKIESKADGRYVNESANFGATPYSLNCNTFNIYSDSFYSAIQITQNAATRLNGAYFWNISAKNIIEYSIDTCINEARNLVFEFIPTSLAAINNPSVSENKVWAIGSTLYLIAENVTAVVIYNQTGVLVKAFQFSGNKSIVLPNGIYFVKSDNNSRHLTSKVLIE